jgi:hypothetical protein
MSAVPSAIQIGIDHEALVGDTVVRRALPRHERRTVGAWCFADHFGPDPVPPGSGLQVGPHPHIGLQTVTWLLHGEVLHSDSLGSEQLIRPGQLNVMTAGHGVAHAEQTPDGFGGAVHGVQLWVAQPEGTRHGAADFEHHSDLPVADLGGGTATVLVGTFGDAISPARSDTALVGAQLDLVAGAAAVGLRHDFEHGLMVLEGAVVVDGQTIEPGVIAYFPTGRDEVDIDVPVSTRAILIGGTPFPEPLHMWWNFVARSHAEIDQARADWQARSDRYGSVESPLDRIPAPPTPWP